LPLKSDFQAGTGTIRTENVAAMMNNATMMMKMRFTMALDLGTTPFDAQKRASTPYHSGAG
jgi:GTP cyclohydrolase III